MDHLPSYYLASYLTVLLVVSVGGQNPQDPCTTYKEIGYEYRSTTYDIPPDESYMCDVYVVDTEGAWYHFDQYTGSKIPEVCQERGSCGTLFPIWMNGSHPTAPGEEVEAVACTHHAECCTFSDKMKVKMCETEKRGTYYVYQLPVVTGCPMSYCAGDREPCEFHEVWDPIKGECTVPTTTMTSTSTSTTTTPTTTATTTTTSSITTTPTTTRATSTLTTQANNNVTSSSTSSLTSNPNTTTTHHPNTSKPTTPHSTTTPRTTTTHTTTTHRTTHLSTTIHSSTTTHPSTPLSTPEYVPTPSTLNWWMIGCACSLIAVIVLVILVIWRRMQANPKNTGIKNIYTEWFRCCMFRAQNSMHKRDAHGKVAAASNDHSSTDEAPPAYEALTISNINIDDAHVYEGMNENVYDTIKVDSYDSVR